MPKQYILIIDAGTTSVRAVVYRENLTQAASAQQEFTQIYPGPGWVEHDMEEVTAALFRVIRRAVARVNPNRIAGIGITNQRETAVLFSGTGKPVQNAVVWQCRRSAGICRSLKSRGFEPLFRKKTGLLMDAYFSGTKVKWLLDRFPALRAQARRGKIRFGTVDTYLIYRLTGGRAHVTDHTNASRTLMFNIRGKRWDPELLKVLGIPSAMLPAVLPSAGTFGTTKGVPGLPDDIPIVSVLGDQQSALAGNLGFKPGNAKITYGTGSFLLLNIGERFQLSRTGLLTTLASDFEGNPVYALEGSVFIAGAAVQWLRDGLKLIKTAPETEKIAQSAGRNTSTFLVPAFVGLGCPYWDMEAQGALFGLRRETTEKEVVQAGLHGIALQVADVYREFLATAGKRAFRMLRADGGASKNNYLMQFQADMLGIPLERARETESTALGAAVLAGAKLGMFDLKKAGKLVKGEKVFRPKINKRLRGLYLENWKRAVAATRSYRPLS